MSQSSASKAGPVSKDLKAIVLVNAIAIVSGILFGVLGITVFQVAVGA